MALLSGNSMQCREDKRSDRLVRHGCEWLATLISPFRGGLQLSLCMPIVSAIRWGKARMDLSLGSC
jgi:hypothetical protein